MTPLAIRRVLFVTALFCLPLPFAIVEHGWVPAAWLASVAALTATAAVAQGAGNLGIMLAQYLVVEALALLAICYLVARLLAWIVVRALPARLHRAVVCVGALGAVSAALLDPIFHTTAVAGGVAVRLLQLFRG